MGHNSPWDQPWGGLAPGAARRLVERRSAAVGAGPDQPGAVGGPGEFGSRGSRGPKVRRGDVRAAILDVLAVEPMNGYQIIQQIAERSGGAWKPSPGSVYPTVQQLEDEGLVEGSEGRAAGCCSSPRRAAATSRSTPTSWPAPGTRSTPPTRSRAPVTSSPSSGR